MFLVSLRYEIRREIHTSYQCASAWRGCRQQVAPQETPRSCNLSDSLREAVVAGVRAEFEAREQKLKEAYASELEKLTSEFNARLAAKQNEINQLKGISDEENPTTTMPSDSNSDSTMST